MITFWLIGAALAVAALAYVLRPLLRGKAGVLLSRREANVSIYRDQLRELEADLASGAVSKADYERSRVELEARLLEDVTAADTAVTRSGGRKAALALALAVPLVAFAVYYLTGDPRGLHPHQAEADAAQFEAMVERLAGKLRDNPEDAEGWKLLGRSYTALGRFDKAVGAYAKAAERSPRDAQLLADFADALAMARGSAAGSPLSGEPERLIERALEIDPNNLKALALSGTVAFERQDYAKAAATWSRMLPFVAADSEDARAIQGNVDEARKLAGIAPGPRKELVEKKQVEKKQVEKKQAEKEQAAKGHPGVRGTVQLAAGLKKNVKPEDTVFVFARAAEGPPAPLAVLRVKARELPLEFQLTDAMAMAPGMTVSAFPRIVVTARVAKSGGVQPTPGDLQGASAAVANNAAGVEVLIDTVLR